MSAVLFSAIAGAAPLGTSGHQTIGTAGVQPSAGGIARQPLAIRPPSEPTSVVAPIEKVVTLARGGTLGSVLSNAGVPAGEIHRAMAALVKAYDPRRLQIGQEITLTLYDTAAGTSLVGLEVEARFDRLAGVTRYPNGDFHSYEKLKHWSKQTFNAKSSIKHSLFSDGLSAGVPTSAMAKFIQLFSFDVDFQRDIQPGDDFEVVFERYQDRNGKLVHTGDLLYASLTTQGRARSYYLFGGEYGDGAFYDRDGSGLRKALLRTPVDGARLTSGFGGRRDPVKGYRKTHKGVDFAAPTGTPIRAAGEGTLTFVGRQRGYGRFITIKHNDDYVTAYAHMSRFARGMSKGKRVKQGQIIAYVGSSGRSTGPHLHYEVRYKGNKVNPRKLRLPSGHQIAGRNLAFFKQQIVSIDAIRSGAREGVATAKERSSLVSEN